MLKPNKIRSILAFCLLLCFSWPTYIYASDAEESTDNVKASEASDKADDGSDSFYIDENAVLPEVIGGGMAISKQTLGIGYATKLYDATSGIPTSEANAVLATSDGFIWIGGYSGLIKYDGTNFVRQDSSTGVTSVNTLFEDNKGRLWVGTNDNGLVRLDRGKSSHWDYSDGLSASSVRTITEDCDGNIFIGTTAGIDYIDENDSLHNLEDPLIDNSYISNMATDIIGIIYGNTKDGRAFSIIEKKVTVYQIDQDKYGIINCVYPSPYHPQSVYLATNSGKLYTANIENNFKDLEEVSLYSGNSGITVKQSENGLSAVDSGIENRTLIINRIDFACEMLWLLNEDSVGYLDSDGHYEEISNLPITNSFLSMTLDYEGNLWFASSRQGVMKIVANKFADVTENAGIESGVVNATCLHDDVLYVGTDSGLRMLSGETRIEDTPIQTYLGSARIRCILEDNDNTLWFASYTGGKGLVALKKDGSITNYTKQNGLIDDQIRCLYLTSDDSILVGTNGGLNVLKNGKVISSYGVEDGMTNTVALTACEGFDGEYYVGTDGDGIYVVKGEKITRLGRDDGLTSDIVMRIKKDEKNGVCWIVTSNSIEYIKDNKITDISEFPYNNNYDIYFDNNDNAWILSSCGVYVTAVRNLLENREKFEYQLYDLSSGLLNIPTGNSYSALDEKGNLYIAGRDGVCLVNIDNYFGLTHKIKLFVPYLEVDGEMYYLGYEDSFLIPSSAKDIKIYGYALTYSMQNPVIRYMLEGFDEEAKTVTKNELEPVRYTNLRGGNYTFSLSVVNSSTGEVQQSFELKIVKKKAFYEEIWFYLLILFVFLTVIFFLVQNYLDRRTVKFLKKEEEQKNLIREIVRSFAKTIDMKDRYTNGHSYRVAKYTSMLAKELGYDEETVDKYNNIALLHDIGKIGVPPEVLNKAGKLTDEEFDTIKSHTTLGYNALKDISIMPELAIGAEYHHERPDGKGYPEGLKGDKIPRVAQIIAVADTFDAMYSDRPYRKRMNFDKAVSIIKEVRGTQLAEDVVDAFLRLVEKGEFRAKDDKGGGTMEDINNIRKEYDKEEEKKNEEKS
ncbi:MAG: HD domain-containing protein [Lachnospiraceae bacterium]|nr:HD domain-containing protein [Lachnospiraceae bacterium]